MKYRILEFKDGYAVEPRFEGEKWFTTGDISGS